MKAGPYVPRYVPLFPFIVRIHLHSASGLVQQLNNHCHGHPDSLLHNHYHVLFTRSSRKHLNQYPLENPDLQQYKRPDSIRISSTRHFDHIVQNKALCTIELYGQNKYENRLDYSTERNGTERNGTERNGTE